MIEEISFKKNKKKKPKKDTLLGLSLRIWRTVPSSFSVVLGKLYCHYLSWFTGLEKIPNDAIVPSMKFFSAYKTFLDLWKEQEPSLLLLLLKGMIIPTLQ